MIRKMAPRAEQLELRCEDLSAMTRKTTAQKLLS